MTSLRRTLEGVLRGPVGGMLLCLLIAGFLGGVAVAHPGGTTNQSSSQTSSSAPSLTPHAPGRDRKSTRLNSSHMSISYAVFCLKKKKKNGESDPPMISQHNN